MPFSLGLFAMPVFCLAFCLLVVLVEISKFPVNFTHFHYFVSSYSERLLLLKYRVSLAAACWLPP